MAIVDFLQSEGQTNISSVFHETHEAPAKAQHDRQMDRQLMDKVIPMCHSFAGPQNLPGAPLFCGNYKIDLFFK